jgi:hypothetical protein
MLSVLISFYLWVCFISLFFGNNRTEVIIKNNYIDEEDDVRWKYIDW